MKFILLSILYEIRNRKKLINEEFEIDETYV